MLCGTLKNDRAMATKRPIEISAMFFMRSGVWADKYTHVTIDATPVAKYRNT
jgi:hypothetical protein